MDTMDQTLFDGIVDDIPEIGLDHHIDQVIRHAKNNSKVARQSIKDLSPLQGPKAQSGIVISAGPSVHKRKSIPRILESGYKGAIIAIDASYIACLKAGLIPDYVVTMDPNPTRMVRWFGDHDFEKNTELDDYYERQDLDVEFRKNTIEQNKRHIKLVNQYGHLSKFVIATTAPANVIDRLKEANADLYWWNPLMDDPSSKESLTRKLYDMNQLPCMNTGGNVGTSAWIFADSILKLPSIAIVGMDLGYYKDTPIEMTQTYYELLNHLGNEKDVQQCFKHYEFPLDKEQYYTDPTYFWYRKNFLELLPNTSGKTFNCTEGGTLFAEGIDCISLDCFIEEHS